MQAANHFEGQIAQGGGLAFFLKRGKMRKFVLVNSILYALAGLFSISGTTNNASAARGLAIAIYFIPGAWCQGNIAFHVVR